MNLTAFEKTQMISYPYPECLIERVNQAIKNDQVFLDLDNNKMWYVRLPDDEMDTKHPIQMKNGLYTHLFWSFRFYPLPVTTLCRERKEQFLRRVNQVMDEIFQRVCEEINEVTIESESNIESLPYSLKDPLFLWDILNHHKDYFESFVEFPKEDILLAIFDEVVITNQVYLMGHEGELRLTIKTNEGFHIVGHFQYRSTDCGIDSIIRIPFTICRLEDSNIAIF